MTRLRILHASAALNHMERKKCLIPDCSWTLVWLVVATLFAVPCSVRAQDGPENSSADQPDEPSLLWDVTKRTLVDPTTYVPAVLSYGAMRLDWDSSQVFFRYGFVEQNPRFTVSGFTYDVPISHAAGNQQILMDSLGILQMSVVNNVTANVLENLLIKRYPHRRTLLRTLGWMERIGFASFWSYRLSAGHVRKWRENERMARRLGFQN